MPLRSESQIARDAGRLPVPGKQVPVPTALGALHTGGDQTSGVFGIITHTRTKVGARTAGPGEQIRLSTQGWRVYFCQAFEQAHTVRSEIDCVQLAPHWWGRAHDGQRLS